MRWRRGWRYLDVCTSLSLFILQRSGWLFNIFDRFELSLLAGIIACISIFFYLLCSQQGFSLQFLVLATRGSRCPHSPVIFHAVDRHQFLTSTRYDSLLRLTRYSRFLSFSLFFIFHFCRGIICCASFFYLGFFLDICLRQLISPGYRLPFTLPPGPSIVHWERYIWILFSVFWN